MRAVHLPVLFVCLLTVFSNSAAAQDPPSSASVYRDPFWPIGYVPKSNEQPEPAPQEEPKEVISAPVLSEAELRALALAEAERIRQTLERSGTATMRGRISALVQGRWVSVGDSFSVEVEGREYRLIITKLTTDNIELEPHRVPRITPNPGNEP